MSTLHMVILPVLPKSTLEVARARRSAALTATPEGLWMDIYFPVTSFESHPRPQVINVNWHKKTLIVETSMRCDFQ